MTKIKFETLEEAKIYLRAHFDDGALCPCCGQYVKRYKRKLHANMAMSLIRLYHKCRDNTEYYHLRDILVGVASTGSNDFNKLKEFGLIEPRVLTKSEKEDGTKKASGYWRITDKGRQFVTGAITVPSHVYLYNGKILKHSTTQTTIREALGKKFNYNELMGIL